MYLRDDFESKASGTAARAMSQSSVTAQNSDDLGEKTQLRLSNFGDGSPEAAAHHTIEQRS
jgi:hypothetical protein